MFARHPVPLTVAFTVLILTASLRAQSDGQITGVVRDATGLVLPGATVTATNQSTKASRTATTGTDGTFSVSVPPGA
jgi:Carboxypeptidase regulatory-like domain